MDNLSNWEGEVSGLEDEKHFVASMLRKRKPPLSWEDKAKRKKDGRVFPSTYEGSLCFLCQLDIPHSQRLPQVK